MANKRMRALVSGRVQGVFFRDSTREKAQALALSGWVRNLVDGRVECEFEGDPSGVKSLCRWLRQGPPLSKVDNLEIEAIETKGSEGSFVVRY